MIGDKIKELRIENGMEQREVAEKIGVTTDAVSKWETGKNYPKLKTIVALEILFGLKNHELIKYLYD